MELIGFFAKNEKYLPKKNEFGSVLRHSKTDPKHFTILIYNALILF